jgi:hypothetical protein
VEFFSITVKDEIEKYELSMKIEVLTKMRDEFLDYKD